MKIQEENLWKGRMGRRYRREWVIGSGRSVCKDVM
jgi:hypothetical protein